MITLYTIDCPKCKVLEAKLNSKQINYSTCKDEEIITNICNEIGLTGLPILSIDNEYLDFSAAIKWINNN